MDHGYIEEHDIRARYALGRLTADEEQAFEGHLVDCPQCIEIVECETGLREGLRAAAQDSATRARTPRTAAIWKATASSGFLAAAAALFLVASIGLGMWLSRSSVELRSARADLDQSQYRARQAEESAAALERRLADVERRANQAPAAPAAGPVIPAAVFALTTVRGSDATGGPVNRFTIDRHAKLVVLSLDVPGQNDSGGYAVSLKDRANRLLWAGGPFPPSSPDSLGVAVDATLLPAGDYLLEVQQRSPAGALTSVGRYPFRVAVR
jgi:anti-sigma factor RsiW